MVMFGDVLGVGKQPTLEPLPATHICACLKLGGHWKFQQRKYGHSCVHITLVFFIHYTWSCVMPVLAYVVYCRWKHCGHERRPFSSQKISQKLLQANLLYSYTIPWSLKTKINEFNQMIFLHPLFAILQSLPAAACYVQVTACSQIYLAILATWSQIKLWQSFFALSLNGHFKAIPQPYISLYCHHDANTKLVQHFHRLLSCSGSKTSREAQVVHCQVKSPAVNEDEKIFPIPYFPLPFV